MAKHLELGQLLDESGIHILTGEADGTTLGRLLCDLKPEGVGVIESFLGVTIGRGTGWNEAGKDCASVMLSRNTLQDLSVFCALYRFEVVTWFPGSDSICSSLIGWTSAEWTERGEDYLRVTERRVTVYVKSGTAAGGFRNQHEFSGRIS